MLQICAEFKLGILGVTKMLLTKWNLHIVKKIEYKNHIFSYKLLMFSSLV
jgi:hypothetical protein